MHFVGLKIAGFKSFVDPVEVTIDGGLTGVVGPNGCGKSNLLEALRWVMGANSAKAMRGGEMDDLIFSGSETRPARELAEVALLLDNSARTAPAPFNDLDEIEVRRALRRGAGSSYRINGRVVRAKDVQILFADASTGANSPALVRQGQISELIGAKPQNRRRILEEAAGVAGLAARRHEAELKLKGAEENLSRLAEIMGELERQTASLKRQAAKARRYKALSARIAALERRLMAQRWRSAAEETAAARSSLEAAKAADADAARLAARSAAQELEARAAIEPLRRAEMDASARFAALRVELTRIEGECEAASKEAEAAAADVARLAAELARTETEAGEAAARAAEAERRLAEAPPADLSQRASARAAAEADLSAARSALEAAEEEVAQRRTEIARTEAEAAAARAALQREEARLARISAETDRIAREIAALGDAAALDKTANLARARRDAAEAAVKTAQTNAAAANREAQARRDAEAKLAGPANDAERRVRELEAELKGLERLVRQPDASAAPPVMDEISAPGLERALAAALDADLEAPLAESAPAHWSSRSGTDTGGALPEGARALGELVAAPPQLKARLAQCGLVDAAAGDRLQGSLATGQRIVSREGDLWRWDGFVRRAAAPLPTAERLAQRARLAACAAELDRARQTLDAARSERGKAQEALATADQLAQAAGRAVPEAVRAAASAREALMRAEQDVERLALRAASLNETQSRLVAERQAAEEAASLARAGAPAPSADGLEELRGAAQTAREAERAAAQALASLIAGEERADSLRAAAARDHADWSARATAAAERLDDLQRRLGAREADLEPAQERVASLALRRVAASEEVAAAELARNAATDQLAEAESLSRESDLSARQVRDAAGRARETLARAETHVEAAVRREAEAAEAARQAFGLELEALERAAALDDGATIVAEATEVDADADDAAEEPSIQGHSSSQGGPAGMERELAELRRTRDALGGVNLEADEQLADISARVGVQTHERDDLTAAIAKLRQGVDALNAEGRARLVAAFEVVNGHFKSLFQTLFNGGEAELRLTEGDDPLDAGLEIYACPPGKRLGTLSLMSGGEQALTATALIFAVFLSRPSPLCVLDEVDAPLDDANVDRFCRMLDEMRRRTSTRFIVITHNAVSMSRMDRLFGVTMQERGVSRLVSVDLEAAERLAAA